MPRVLNHDILWDLGACSEGREWWLERYGDADVPVTPEMVKATMKVNPYWGGWLLMMVNRDAYRTLRHINAEEWNAWQNQHQALLDQGTRDRRRPKTVQNHHFKRVAKALVAWAREEKQDA